MSLAFFVVATDPAGAPLAFRRVFCESEKGIAILEPSSGGVAFEHTGPDGSMSGLLGGVTPGSYIIECRLEEGFNLVARRRLKVSGEVPAGFAGFPGAAGGNLGGGSIQPNPNLTVDLLQILFNGQGLTDDPNGPIDTELWTDCNFDGLATLSDIEPYTYDEYKLKIKNSFNEPLQIESVQFIIHDGREVTSDPRQLTGLYIGTGDTGEVVGTFTEPVQAAPYIKAFAGTTSTVIDGTYNVEFIVKGTTLSGESFTISNTGSVTFGGVNNC